MAVCELCNGKTGWGSSYSVSLPSGSTTKEYKICEVCNTHIKNLTPEGFKNNPSMNMDEYERISASLLDRVSDYSARQALTGFLENNREVIGREAGVKVNPFGSLEGFLLTTGYDFQGYRIKKYMNIVHGETVLGTGFFSDLSADFHDFFGTSSATLEGKISQAKRFAERQAVQIAAASGANALIGVSYNIMTLFNNMIVVSVDGTAVVTEKTEGNVDDDQ